MLHIGHVVREMDDKIVVFGDHNYRYDIPKSKIIAVGRNVIIDMDFPQIFKYKVNIDSPLPTGEPIEKSVEEEHKVAESRQAQILSQYQILPCSI